jgi:hypothetical protein
MKAAGEERMNRQMSAMGGAGGVEGICRVDAGVIDEIREEALGE